MLADMINKLKEGQVAIATYGGERWYITNSEGVRYCDMNGDNIGELVTLSKSNILAHYGILENKIRLTDGQIDDLSNFVEKALIEVYKPKCAITSMMVTSGVEYMVEDELVSEAIRLSKVLNIMSRNE